MLSIRSFVAACACLSAAAAPALSQPLTVLPGQDHWKTSGPTGINFGGSIPPIPPGFFAPGSEPFMGFVVLEGSPLFPGSLNPSDTVIQRMGPGSLPFDGAATSIPIEIVALSLRSIEPIQINVGTEPTFWDIHITIDAFGPRNGNAMLQRMTPGSGAMNYNYQFRPQITFQNIEGGPVLAYPLPPTAIVNVFTPQPIQWITEPPPFVFPGQGPNLFPVSPAVSAGTSFNQTAMPPNLPGPDCNNNLINDASDICAGTSQDANGDGIPDECQASIVAVLQDSFADRAGGFVSPFSDHGSLIVRAVEPPSGVVSWLNAVIDGRWAVQNMPIQEMDGAGLLHDYVVRFDLGNEPGVPAPLVNITWQITRDPTGVQPPPGLVTTLPVAEHVLESGLIGPDAGLSIFPGPATDFINPAILIQWEVVTRRNVPGVTEAKNHCAPGAAARSLMWMKDLYCLSLPAACDTAQEIYDKLRDATHMMTTEESGTESVAKAVMGIQQMITDKMLAGMISVDSNLSGDPDDVVDALKAGKDVIGIIIWLDENGDPVFGHAVTVTGAVKCGDNVVIGYRDDVHGDDKQGDGNADTDNETKGGKIAPDGNGGHTLEGHAKNTWLGFIQICPTRLKQLQAFTKWFNGDGVGGMVEGVLPLVTRVNDPAQLTPAERTALKTWLCNMLDTACYLQTMVHDCGSPAARDLADEIKAKADLIKRLGVEWLMTGRAVLLAALRAELAQLQDLIDDLTAELDCNGNGTDDKADIENGTSQDANHDMIPDECQCLADWNNDGIISPQDIFDFLRDFFSRGADINHSGTTTPQDIFDFLRLFFSNCN